MVFACSMWNKSILMTKSGSAVVEICAVACNHLDYLILLDHFDRVSVALCRSASLCGDNGARLHAKLTMESSLTSSYFYMTSKYQHLGNQNSSRETSPD